MDYTMANLKRDMAAKMPQGLKMNGEDSGYGRGMRYTGIGQASDRGRGMSYNQNGQGSSRRGGMNYTLSNPKSSFSKNYTQNARPKDN